MKKLIFLSLILLTIANLTAARKFPIPNNNNHPLNYLCYKTEETLNIDGKLTEESWINAEWSEEFVDIEGDKNKKPPYKTQMKMLWNEKYLYVGAFLEEEHLWATLKERDSVIFFDNDFEIFLDPDDDTHDYFEFEVNAFNTLWDLLIIKPYRDRDDVSYTGWDAKGIQTAVHFEGTLNNSSDIDKYWSVEFAIPWSAIKDGAHMPLPPQNNNRWRVNFSRVQWHIQPKGNSYIKKKLPEMNIVWSPQGLVAMHYPEKWGYLMFSTNIVGSDKVDFIPDPLYKEKQYLRELYYAEKEFYQQNGRYSNDYQKLNIKKKSFNGKSAKFYIGASSYEITLECNSKDGMIHIFEDGRLIEHVDHE